MGRHTEYNRGERLSNLFKEILGEALLEIDDERLEFVTIVEVDVDDNLNRALVLVVSPNLSDNSEDQILEAFNENKGSLMNAISSTARIRRMPELIFKFDEGAKASAHIEDIIKKLDIPPQDA